jgi:hypothetical protein
MGLGLLVHISIQASSLALQWEVCVAASTNRPSRLLSLLGRCEYFVKSKLLTGLQEWFT